ncbi:MAG: hypothetical protein UU93_C0015G0004 [Candidatus Amesbacteria bacterium GW2011_GWA2_42_12]|uniref:Uncharacterized protein n=1 Tax=Candidatus Amesbacteria bacterium GW2011_GWA2_42_12 TaxID=1618356 RepID=A0A0G0Y4G4_9BACT|nr:MAG: hypothetical protein UU93_C0015G0004 [Candidatus Amesbacteria bacterium GW2011_GWA2_42_12]
MENIIQADIFFFITGIAVIIFTICAIVVMFYVIRILRDMKIISKTMLRESDNLANDIEFVREAVRSEGAKVRTVADFFLGLFNRRQKEVKKKKVAK